MARILVVFALLLVGAIYYVLPWFERLNAPERRRLGKGVLLALGAGALGFVAIRAGYAWQAAAGSTVVAALRRGVPWVVKSWPIVERAWKTRWQDRNARPELAGAITSERVTALELSSSGRMSREYALTVLGLDERATPDDVHRAAGELLESVRSNGRGGSPYLVAQIEGARVTLLG